MWKVFDMHDSHTDSSTAAKGGSPGVRAVAIGVIISVIIADGEKGGAAASP